MGEALLGLLDGGLFAEWAREYHFLISRNVNAGSAAKPRRLLVLALERALRLSGRRHRDSQGPNSNLATLNSQTTDGSLPPLALKTSGLPFLSHSIFP